MNVPFGYFVQGQSLGGAQITALLEHLQRLQPTTVSVMDNYPLCVQIQNLLPSCIVVARDSTFEPAPDYSNAALTKYLLSFSDKRIVMMVNCEAGFDSARVSMWVRFIQIAEMLGYRLCVGNTSSGSIKSGQANDPNQWLTDGRPLLEALRDYPKHFLGVHQYTPDFLWVVTNGGWGDPEISPKAADWAKPQWHLARELQGIFKAEKTPGEFKPLYARSFMIITEGLIDEMNDVRSNPDYPYKGLKSNRWRDCIPAWAKWYPSVDPENILASQYQWAWETLYQGSGCVLGIHAFTWADTSGQWAGDRLDNALTYQRIMELYKPMGSTQPPPVIAPPAPPPADTSAARAEVEAQLLVLQNKYVSDFKALMDKLIALK